MPPAASAPPAVGQNLKISPIAVGQAAYGDLFNIIRQMWPVLLLLSALYFVCTMAWFIAPIFVSSWVGRMVMRMLIFVGIAWLATPYYVALHRFVSTGEVRWLPPRDNYGQSSLIYFAWGALTVMLWFMPQVLGNAVDAFFPNVAALAVLIIILVVSVLLVRMTTLLPAAALTPERASWAQAMEDSRGRFWRIWLATTGAVLPAIIVLFIIGRAAGSQAIEAVPFFLIAVPTLLTLQIVPLAAGTRIYEMLRTPRITDRMRQVLRA